MADNDALFDTVIHTSRRATTTTVFPDKDTRIDVILQKIVFLGPILSCPATSIRRPFYTIRQILATQVPSDESSPVGNAVNLVYRSDCEEAFEVGLEKLRPVCPFGSWFPTCRCCILRSSDAAVWHSCLCRQSQLQAGRGVRVALSSKVR